MADDPAPLDLAPIRARAEKATPGPWKVVTEVDYDDYMGSRSSVYPRGVQGGGVEWQWVVRFDDDYGTDQMADGQFIAHARQDVPALLAYVDQLRALLGEIAASSLLFPNYGGAGVWACRVCYHDLPAHDTECWLARIAALGLTTETEGAR